MVVWHGQPAIDVVWFFVPASAPTYDKPNVYVSSNWQTEKHNPPIGEQGLEPRPWYSGENIWGYSGQGACGADSVTARGGIWGVDQPFYTNPQGLSLCCKVPDVARAGGWVWGGSAVQGKPPLSLGGGWVWGGAALFPTPLVASGGWVWGGSAVQGSEENTSDIALSLCPANPLPRTLYARSVSSTGAPCGPETFRLEWDDVAMCWQAIGVDCGALGMRDFQLRAQSGTLIFYVFNGLQLSARSLFSYDCTRSFFQFILSANDACAGAPFSLMWVDPTGSGNP